MSDNERIYYSSCFQEHQVSLGHPECPERLQAIVEFIQSENRAKGWQWCEPQMVQSQWFEYAHPSEYVKQIFALLPDEGEPFIYLDGDTCWSSQSGKAVLLAGGSLKEAIDWSMSDKKDCMRNGIPISFCLSRPPGHHAERMVAMGFCVFGFVGCAAIYAHRQYALERVAVLDFDVHHGNGTEDILGDYPTFFFASTYQQAIFPAGTIAQNNVYRKCLPMPAQTDSCAFQSLWENDVFSQLMDYQPQCILVSAGFDAHRNDPLANCLLIEEDFYFLGKRIKEIATMYQAPVIANLEGGYHVDSLAKSVYAFMQGLAH